MKKNLQNYDESRNNMYSGFRNGSRDVHLPKQGNLRGCVEQYTAAMIQEKQ